MARTSVKKNAVKQVNYLNKDFSDFRDNLIDFAKTYFPNTHNDFNEASPGMMFIEMAAYVGDVLSYYIDSQFRESLLTYAEEKKNVYNIAQSFGYKPRTTTPATTILDVFQTIPALNEKPDFRYALNIRGGAQINSRTGTTFRTLEDVNFKFSSSFDPREVEIFETDSGTPTKFLLKKQVKAESGTIISETFNFNSAKKYTQIKLANKDVIDIISCVDSDGNNWNQVDFLAQDTVFEDIENNAENDPTSVTNREVAPYLLKLKKTPRRFTKFINENDETVLRFGAGTDDSSDEEIIPNPDNVGLNLPGSPSKLGVAFDPSNFLKTKTFGQAPANTTLTITYSYGGGIGDNVGSGTITDISSISYQISDVNLSNALLQDSKESVSFTNPKPAAGGGSGETIKEVRENALAYYQAQSRVVTKEDYIVRAYSLPQRYGNIAKAHLVQNEQLNLQSEKIVNPLALDMYTLGFDADKKLAPLTNTVKENLKTYISQFRLVTDAVNIKDAYVINIGVKFSILTKVGFNKNDVLLRCVSAVKDFFNIDRFQIGQPIILSDIAYELSLIDGVASIVPPTDKNPDRLPVVIENKHKISDGYSGNFYDISQGIIDGILYPALDPSIFEVKYPNIDIQGKVVGDNLASGD